MAIFRTAILAMALLICLTRLAYALHSQTLVIVTNEYPPYVLADTPHSFLPDLFAAIGREMGIHFDVQIMPWKRGEYEVKNLSAWGAAPYVRTPERDKIYDFSAPLYTSASDFFAYSKDGTKPDIPYETLADLRNYRIGGIQGYYYQKMFKEAGLDVDYALNEEQNFQRLQLGRIDLFPAATTVGWYIVYKMFPPDQAAKFYTLKKPLVPEKPLSVMISKQYPDGSRLLARFNAALARIKANGTYDRLVDKYKLVLRY
jgi:polar amino acid transport system substrate-binding protein